MNIDKLLDLTYDELVIHLQNKYGIPKYSYFINDTYKSRNPKNTRTKEGLVIHHIDEDKAIMLSTVEYARLNPFEYQKADRLVYCNLIEHLLLHIKIVEYPNPNQNKNELCGVGGIINFLVPELNDIFSGIEYKREYQRNLASEAKKYKDEYFKCIKKLVDMNFQYPLLTSFNTSFGIWSHDKNRNIYEELIKLGVKK